MCSNSKLVLSKLNRKIPYNKLQLSRNMTFEVGDLQVNIFLKRSCEIPTLKKQTGTKEESESDYILSKNYLKKDGEMKIVDDSKEATGKKTVFGFGVSFGFITIFAFGSSVAFSDIATSPRSPAPERPRSSVTTSLEYLYTQI